MNIKNIRMLSQQLAAPQWNTPEEVVGWMGAMQAQEYQMMRWAVGMRTRRPSLRAFREAYDAGRIVRTHLFRTTWQLVTASDLRWMLSLCAERNRRAINGYLSYYGDAIADAEYQRSNRLFERLLGDGPLSATRSWLASRFAAEGFTADAHHFSVLLRRAETDGIICSGSLTDDREGTYSLTERKIPATPLPPRDEALALLARMYFRSHGPATLADFVWWSGLSAGDCRRGMAALGTELVAEQQDGDTYYLHAQSRTRGFRSGQTHLLPSYDEYLIAYKSRHHVLAPEHRHHAHDQKGIFWPVVLCDGRVVGNWKAKPQQVTFFQPDYECPVTFGAYERFLRR